MAEIDKEITATGSARVLVYMNDGISKGVASRFVAAPASPPVALVRSRVETRGKPPPVRTYEHLGLMLGTVDADSFAALKKDPAVKRIAPAPQISLIRPVAAAAAKLTTRHTWGIRRLKAYKLWEQGHTGKGQRVGHLDTGVDGTHPCLRGAIADFVELDDRRRRCYRAHPRWPQLGGWQALHDCECLARIARLA